MKAIRLMGVLGILWACWLSQHRAISAIGFRPSFRFSS